MIDLLTLIILAKTQDIGFKIDLTHDIIEIELDNGAYVLPIDIDIDGLLASIKFAKTKKKKKDLEGQTLLWISMKKLNCFLIFAQNMI